MLISSALPQQRYDSRVFSKNYLSLDQSFGCQAFALLPCHAKLRHIPLVSVALKLSVIPVDLRYACGIRGSESLLKMLAVTGRSARRRSELHSRATTEMGGRYGIPYA